MAKNQEDKTLSDQAKTVLERVSKGLKSKELRRETLESLGVSDDISEEDAGRLAKELQFAFAANGGPPAPTLRGSDLVLTDAERWAVSKATIAFLGSISVFGTIILGLISAQLRDSVIDQAKSVAQATAGETAKSLEKEAEKHKKVFEEALDKAQRALRDAQAAQSRIAQVEKDSERLEDSVSRITSDIAVTRQNASAIQQDVSETEARSEAQQKALSELQETAQEQSLSFRNRLVGLRRDVDGQISSLSKDLNKTNELKDQLERQRGVIEGLGEVGDLIKEIAETKRLQAKLLERQTYSIGTVVAWPNDARLIPSDWLACDGKEIDPENYPQLIKTLGNRFPSKSNKPCVPDYRGFFLRGADESGDRDPDTLVRKPFKEGWPSGSDVGSFQSDVVGAHKHDYVGHRELHYTGTGPDKGFLRLSVKRQTASFGGSETRPKNVSVIWIIKAR